MKPINLSFIAIALFLVVALNSFAQNKLQGSYVVTKVVYQNDEELDDANDLKYTYLKYTFGAYGRLNVSPVYYDKGSPFKYTLDGDRLTIISTAESVLNVMKVLEITPTKLVLVSGAAEGLDDPYAIKYIFCKEQLLQEKMPLSSEDIHSIHGTDTVFKSNRKIYAAFDGDSFQEFVFKKLDGKKSGTENGLFISTFVIDENGSPGDLKIVKGINPKYDAAYIKVFNSAAGKWQPATYNGRNVKVLMNLTIRYLSSEDAMPSYFDLQKGNAAYNEGDFETALFFYDRVIERLPYEIVALYRRGICRRALGNHVGACEDWSAIKALDSPMADELLLKYCN